MRSDPPLKASVPGRPSQDSGGAPRHSGSYSLTDGLELKDTLLSIFRSPQYKPPVLPAIALELTELTRKASVSYEEVSRVLEKDPLLVASVLKLAQSPLYGGRLRMHSLKEALQRLGVNTLRDMVWQVVVGLRLFRAQAFASTMERLQSHSTFTAYAARVIATHAGISAEHAFLCGLLHDVGWSGALVTISESGKNLPPPAVLFTAIDKMHAEAALAMGTLWGLAPEVVDVIGHHHDVERPGHPVPNLVPVLCVAEQLADEFDFGVESRAEGAYLIGLDEHIIGRYEHAVTALHLTDKMAQIRQQLETIAERIRSPESGSSGR